MNVSVYAFDANSVSSKNQKKDANMSGTAKKCQAQHKNMTGTAKKMPGTTKEYDRYCKKNARYCGWL